MSAIIEEASVLEPETQPSACPDEKGLIPVTTFPIPGFTATQAEVIPVPGAISVSLQALPA